MTDAEFITLFQEALNDVVPSRASEFTDLTLQTSFEDLSLDSVTFMELLGFVEERVGKTFADDQIAQVSTLGDIAALVRA